MATIESTDTSREWVRRRRSYAVGLLGMLLSILVWLPVQTTAKVGQSAADFYLGSMEGTTPGASARLDQYAGHLQTTPQHYLYFWLVQSQSKYQFQNGVENLIIWLNGGPGCSSMDGMFLEVGPWRINKDREEIEYNPYSWIQNANMLFVDQPVGTGYSYSTTQDSLLKTESQVATEFLQFLENFYKVFPALRKHHLYFAGESWAGIYIPYIAKAILQHNDQANSGGAKIPLKGLLIGNGWMDPARQYEAYHTYAIKNNLLSGKFIKESEQFLSKCKAKLSVNEKVLAVNECEELPSVLERASKSSGQNCLNMYDIRLRDDTPDGGCGMKWPPGLGKMKEILNRIPFLSSIHADGGNKSWTECSNHVSKALNNDNSPPSYLYLPELLEKLQILLFSGDKDYICNHMGTEAMIAGLTWNGAKGFGESSKKGVFNISAKSHGEWNYARNLTYALIYDASHMVPVDQPIASLEMVQRFLAFARYCGGSDVPGGLKPFCQRYPLDPVPVRELFSNETFGSAVLRELGLPLSGTKEETKDSESSSKWVSNSATVGWAILLLLLAVALALGIVYTQYKGQYPRRSFDLREFAEWMWYKLKRGVWWVVNVLCLRNERSSGGIVGEGSPRGGKLRTSSTGLMLGRGNGSGPAGAGAYEGLPSDQLEFELSGVEVENRNRVVSSDDE